MSVEILAPMPGKIIDVLVKVGDTVSEDDELVILEAMKMENPVYATAGGVVKEIKIAKDSTVEADQLLVILE
jgi:acetyl-CoA carboxylase biotin carboxyl carrier protein